MPRTETRRPGQELVWVEEVLGFTQLCDTENVSKIPEVSSKKNFKQGQAEICSSYSKAVTSDE